MKKAIILIVLGLFLISASSTAKMNPYIAGEAGRGSAGVDPCESCPDAENGADVLCEEFPSVEGNCNWEIYDSGSRFTIETPTGTLPCSFNTTTCLAVYLSNTSANPYIRKILSNYITTGYYDFSLWVDSAHDSDSYILQLEDNSGGGEFYMSVRPSDGHLKFIFYNDDGEAPGPMQTTYTANAIPRDQWMRIAITFIHGTDGGDPDGFCSVKIYYADGTLLEDVNFADTSVHEDEIGRIKFRCEGGEGETVKYKILALRIDDDAAPTCP